LKIAIFVDGDFWHGWRFISWRLKLSPAWEEKIAANMRRDRRVRRALRLSGWTVIRVWEHQIERDIDRCVNRIVSGKNVARKLR
jgi:DNA mismatch endonuclease (patch repair protein)